MFAPPVGSRGAWRPAPPERSSSIRATRRTFDLTLLAFPSLVDLPVSAVSLDPSVATVSPAAQVIPTGESRITLTVTATASGNAETRIDLVFGVDRRTLRVVVGVPDAADAPTAIAPPVGIDVQSPP